MKTVTESCDTCGSTLKILKKEWTRQKKTNPNRVFYCNLSCSGKTSANVQRIQKLGEIYGGFSPEQVQKARIRNTKYTREQKPFQEILRRIKNRVREKTRFRNGFDLDLEYLTGLWDEQAAKCALTGVALSFNIENKLLYPSLDRIKSDMGYQKGNVQFVCTAANMGKGDASDAQFKEFLRIAADQLD